jgi:hypothetical protein
MENGMPPGWHQIAPRIKEKISNRKGDLNLFDKSKIRIHKDFIQTLIFALVMGKKRLGARCTQCLSIANPSGLAGKWAGAKITRRERKSISYYDFPIL